MPAAVLDSYALLAYLFKEKGHIQISRLLEEALEADQALLISAVNWAEIRYIIQRKIGSEAWEKSRPKILSLPIEIVPPDQTAAEIAGEIKAAKKMSLADCFVAALAKIRGAAIYTGDPEFRSLGPDWKIVWL